MVAATPHCELRLARSAACTIGGVLEAAKMSRSRATDLLLDAVAAAGGARVDQSNAEATIGWALTKGAEAPLLERA